MRSGFFCYRNNNVWFWEEHGLVSSADMKCQKYKKGRSQHNQRKWSHHKHPQDSQQPKQPQTAWPLSPLPTPSSPPSTSPATVRAQLSVPSRPRSFRRPPRSLPTSRCSAKPSWPVGKSSRESLPGGWRPGHDKHSAHPPEPPEPHPVRQPANRSHSKWHSHPPRSTAGCRHYLSVPSHKQRRPPPPRRPVPWGSTHRSPQTQREGIPRTCPHRPVPPDRSGGRSWREIQQRGNQLCEILRTCPGAINPSPFEAGHNRSFRLTLVGHFVRPCTPSHPASS